MEMENATRSTDGPEIVQACHNRLHRLIVCLATYPLCVRSDQVNESTMVVSRGHDIPLAHQIALLLNLFRLQLSDCLIDETLDELEMIDFQVVPINAGEDERALGAENVARRTTMVMGNRVEIRRQSGESLVFGSGLV